MNIVYINWNLVYVYVCYVIVLQVYFFKKKYILVDKDELEDYIYNFVLIGIVLLRFQLVIESNNEERYVLSIINC